MTDTVIFDLDGTLLDTLTDLMDSVNFALGRFGYPERTLDEIRRFVGNGVRVLMQRSVPNGVDGDAFEKVFAVFREHYLSNMRNKTDAYGGVRELLKVLKENGYKIGVVSNKLDEAVKELCADYFGPLVDFAKGAEGESDRKPNPSNTWKCIDSLGSKRENCIYVGDSEVDIKTAANAGLPCVSVTWGFRTRDELSANGASELIDSPRELLGILGIK
ncbi:MAG: HAD-IIIA family hydrolase [Oscillospiraceae bacterium]|nr:HAD-IIIA family hydrolase [Oscillospiraceae bacterium]